jgi:hypothetical protein
VSKVGKEMLKNFCCQHISGQGQAFVLVIKIVRFVCKGEGRDGYMAGEGRVLSSGYIHSAMNRDPGN